MNNKNTYQQEDYGFNSKYTTIYNGFIKAMRYEDLMNANDWLVFSVMLSYRKEYNIYVYEGYLASICTICGFKRQTFDRTIKKLKNLELITVTKKARNNSEKTIVEFINTHLYIYTKGRDFLTDFTNYKNKLNIQAKEKESVLIKKFMKLRGFSTKEETLNFISAKITDSGESVEEYCKRIINIHKETEEEIIASLLKNK